MTFILAESVGDRKPLLADDVGDMVEAAIRASPNNRLMQAALGGIAGPEQLVRFLHGFLHFNDALAARVPYLAGWIHLNPELFADPADVEAFCRQRNARISAHIAEAAADEYRMSPGGDMVHQRLSQLFFRGVLGHFGMNGDSFDHAHPLSGPVRSLLREARTRYFHEAGPEPVFAAIGFHVGLEFFANEEFNLVDSYLKERHADLVATLKNGADGDVPPYLWLSLHTVVEIGHYRAGLEAVRDAIRYCHPAEAAPRMAREVLGGLAAFADLQRRFYQTVLAEGAGETGTC